MSLAPGTRLGPYEVTAQIGVGGMGEVYRARDTKLGRDVAIKVLPDIVAQDAERLARFDREARTLAALNHPGIAAIYGLEESDGVKALVMELVEGRTLDELIHSGQPEAASVSERLMDDASAARRGGGAPRGLKIEDALAIARQIAEALEAAHELGIIHRDLKPANVKVRDDGTVKVLDFGLAKAMEPAEMSGSPIVSVSPTITSPAMTQMGMILGTAAYMSPEQARGRPVDRRADIWAFGCVLYEMLTGKRVFEGDDVSVTLARVLEREPSFEQLPPGVPARVRTVLGRCLEKDPRQRVRDIGDVQLALDGAFETVVGAAGESVASPPASRWRRALPFAATALAMTGVLLAVGWAVWPSPPAAPVTRSTHLLPEGVRFRGTHRPVVAIAPDASRFVYNSDVGLRVRERGSLADHVIAGTEQGVNNPFFSPDGLSVGFWEGETRQLRKIAVSGGASTPLTPRIANPFGASWETDGTILYGQRDGIWRVSANGGEPEHVIVTEPGEPADGPRLLPGGEWVLFAVTRASGQTRWDEAEIVAQSLVTGERRPIRQGGSDARYLPTGHLLYARRDVLHAVPFDVSRLEETGGPSPIVEGVMRASGAAVNGGAAMAAVAADGTLVYVPGTPDEARVLVHVDARGEAQPLGVPAAGYQALRVSPDGMFVAAEVARGEVTAIWVADLTRATLSPVTSVDAVGDFAPVWSPDGRQVIYVSQRDGVWGFYRRSADGVGAEELLAEVEGADQLFPGNWSPDGSSLVFMMRRTNETSRDVGVLSLDGDPMWRLLLHSEADEAHPVISPNGQWLAYSSDEGGSPEVYLQRFPDLGGRRQVSISGGIDPVWAPDGRKLYYIRTVGNGPPVEMAAVSVDPAPPLSIGTPEGLFSHVPYRRPQRTPRWYDVTPAGDGLVMVAAASTAGGDAPAPQVITVQGWFQELKRLSTPSTTR